MHINVFIKMGVLMKNKVMYYVVLFLYVFKVEKIFPDHRKIKNKIDPTSDFRPPVSLVELLHERLSNILELCEELAVPVRSHSVSVKLSDIQDQIQMMSDTYSQMAHSSKLHAIYRDDKEFLQRLIDRIDSMIEELQRSPHINTEEKNILRSCFAKLHDLQNGL